MGCYFFVCIYCKIKNPLVQNLATRRKPTGIVPLFPRQKHSTFFLRNIPGMSRLMPFFACIEIFSTESMPISPHFYIASKISPQSKRHSMFIQGLACFSSIQVLVQNVGVLIVCVDVDNSHLLFQLYIPDEAVVHIDAPLLLAAHLIVGQFTGPFALKNCGCRSSPLTFDCPFLTLVTHCRRKRYDQISSTCHVYPLALVLA